jgi:hypothetical protein
MPPSCQSEPEKPVPLPKKIASSPLLYVLLGYVAAYLVMVAQDLIVGGRLVPGSAVSDALGYVLVPSMAVCPLLGALLAIWHLCQRHRLVESIVSLAVSAPALLLVVLVVLNRR